MAKSFVLTNRKKLDEFLSRGNKIEDLGMAIGQVSGKPKYPKGHVGRKSRDSRHKPKRKIHQLELQRRASIRAASKQLEGYADKEARKEARKNLVAMFKREKVSFRGLGRRGSAPAVAVARVAGVIASDKTSGQYHTRILGTARKVRIKPSELRAAMFLENKTMARVLTDFARKKKAELRQSFLSTGHKDTGRLLRHIQYVIWDVDGKKRVMDLERAQRALARAQRKVAKLRGKG